MILEAILTILLLATIALMILNWREYRRLQGAAVELNEFSENVTGAVNTQGKVIEQLVERVGNLTAEGELIKVYLQAHDNTLQLYSNFDKIFKTSDFSKLENL